MQRRASHGVIRLGLGLRVSGRPHDRGMVCDANVLLNYRMRNLFAMSDENKVQFAESLLKALDSRPFGTPSKSELDGFLYDALVRAQYVSDDEPLFSVAERLQVSPSRVNGFRYSSRLREGNRDVRLERLGRAVSVVLSSTKGNRVVLNVEDRFWRDMLEAELKLQGVYVDYSFNRERLVLESADATEKLVRVFRDAGAPLEVKLQEARRRAHEQQFGDVFGDLAKKASQGLAGAAGAKAVALGAVPLSALFGVGLG